MPELLFCQAQMDRAMIHQSNIILEAVYDPVLQMLDLRQKNPLAVCWVFPKVSWIANSKKFLDSFKSEPNDSNWKGFTVKLKINTELRRPKHLITVWLHTDIWMQTCF